MQNQKPFVAILMGDAAGIGPEIILQSLAISYPSTCDPIVIGDIRIFERISQVVKSSLSLKAVKDPREGQYQPGIVNILHMGEPAPEMVPLGKVSSLSGKASVDAIRKAVQICGDNSVKAILSAPLNKESIHLAGFSYLDECDLLADLTGSSSPMMLLISEKMRLATIPPLHISLKQACESLTAEKILESLKILNENLIAFGIPKPIIGVPALNPHGGEKGLFGDEEIREIIPGIEAAKKIGLDIRGPFPADSFFYRAFQGEFDAVLTLYHDQGRTAMKAAHFGQIIIVMIGIPIVYVTVAHGTAYDKAGKGEANPGNFIKALQFVDGIRK